MHTHSLQLLDFYFSLCPVELSRVGKSPSSGLPTQHVDHADIQFGSPIDRGAYGEVFRGVWQGNDVAIKVFSAGLLTSEGVASFQREVFVMNCLRHPNVVLLLGACQTPPKLSIIMEYVAGGSLHKASEDPCICTCACYIKMFIKARN